MSVVNFLKQLGETNMRFKNMLITVIGESLIPSQVDGRNTIKIKYH